MFLGLISLVLVADGLPMRQQALDGSVAASAGERVDADGQVDQRVARL